MIRDEKKRKGKSKCRIVLQGHGVEVGRIATARLSKPELSTAKASEGKAMIRMG